MVSQMTFRQNCEKLFFPTLNRFGSVRVESIRFGSGRIRSYFFKVMKVRAHISMVKMMGKVQLQKADPHQEHVVSSVNEGAKELKKQNKGHMN